jgi:hypothetical protein
MTKFLKTAKAPLTNPEARPSTSFVLGIRDLMTRPSLGSTGSKPSPRGDICLRVSDHLLESIIVAYPTYQASGAVQPLLREHPQSRLLRRLH